jgi:beta-N-acetylhexosaminidase
MLQLMHSFQGTTVPPEILAEVRAGRIGAFCLFNFNVESPAQLRALTDSLTQAAHAGGHPAPIIGIDQEGGQLMAITRGTTPLPGNMALGAARRPDLAEKAGRILGRELLAMGVNLNFAPSVDINSNPLNPVIGIRAFGDDPVLVGDLGAALLTGMQAEGVIATAKHFPGHGDTASDTHFSVPIVERSRASLDEIELQPFRSAIRAGVGAVLSAHVIYQALDPLNPATISRAIMSDLLRGELGFAGLTITDAMDMHAVSRLGIQSVRDAIDAGVDLVLLGHLPDQIALIDRVAGGASAESDARVLRARHALPRELPLLSVVGSKEHRQIAQEIADAAVTVVRASDQLPILAGSDTRILLVTPELVDLTPADTSSGVTLNLADSLRARGVQVQELTFPHHARPEHIQTVLAQAETAVTIIVGTIAAENHVMQAEMVNALIDGGHRPVVIAMRTPYDVLAFPRVETYLCTYGVREPNLEAAARILFGEIEPVGTLPCKLPGLTLPSQQVSL